MKRRKFFAAAGTTVLATAGVYYMLSDKSNLSRADMKTAPAQKTFLQPEEREILYLASLAPSGHNAQPWFVKHIAPYHWIVGNDRSKWLSGVDPTQRETILSIGAFIQNLEYAANYLGYVCQFTLLAGNNQDDEVIEVKLSKASNVSQYDVQKIKRRRTLRAN